MSEEITRCEQVVRDLIQRRDKLNAKSEEISAQRKRLGYEVFAAGDKAARKEFDRINSEAGLLAGEVEGLNGAIVEATARLDAARQAVTAAENRVKSEQLQVIVERVGERTRKVDDLLEKAGQEAVELSRDLAEMRQLGAEFSQAMLISNVDLALRTWLMKLPGSWGREFRSVAPGMRRSFAGYFESMTAGIEAGIRRKLGEADPEPAPKPNPPVTKPAAAASSGDKKPSHRSVPADWIKEKGPAPRTEPKVPASWIKDNQPAPQPSAEWLEEQKQGVG
jgi:hypothetical protein